MVVFAFSRTSLRFFFFGSSCLRSFSEEELKDFDTMLNNAAKDPRFTVRCSKSTDFFS